VPTKEEMEVLLQLFCTLDNFEWSLQKRHPQSEGIMYLQKFAEKIGRFEELSDFERGNVIGQVFYNKYVSEILSLLDIPATVNFK